jgi:hypothetical protein
VSASRAGRWVWEPHGSRYRLRVVRAVACVVVLLLAGCSGSVGAPPPGAVGAGGFSPAPTGAPAPQNSGETCTQIDLDGPVLAMPKPRPVDSTTIVNAGIVARLDPAPGAKPKFTPEQAWDKVTLANPLHARSADLLLGKFNAIVPLSPTGPQTIHAFAWILHVHHLAYALPTAAKNDTGGTGLATLPPVCEFVDAMLVVDATTGASVVYSY